MTDPRFTDQALDDNRKFFRDAANGKGQSFLPVKERAGQVADMLDELAERRKEATVIVDVVHGGGGGGPAPCRACGERGHTNGQYCPDHS